MKNILNQRRTAAFFLLLLLALITAGCGNKSAPVDAADVQWDTYNESSEAFITALAADDFAAAVSMLNRTMARLMNEAALRDTWEQITARAGAFVSFHKTENATADGYYICNVTSQHESSGVLLRVVFDKNGLVAGFFIMDYPVIADDEPAQHEGFADEAVTIGAGTDFPLSGILSMPDNVTGKVPAAVIVHGSGPNDMNLTMFSNKPYRDIAEYLAANGIAVLRYNKRTYTYGALDGGSTVSEETIEDAILAAEILKADPRIDDNRVFIIGHSLGGMLAPRIHAEGGDFAGLILLAGSPRFLLDISRDQNVAYINAAMEGAEMEAALSQLEESWDEQIMALVNLPDDEAKQTPVDAGMSAYYIKDLYENPASKYLEGITVPMLIMQGTSDLQVLADTDFALYKELLAAKSNVTFKLYEGLNHLFMTGISGTSILNLMDEYAIEGNVDAGVLADIAEWVTTDK